MGSGIEIRIIGGVHKRVGLRYIEAGSSSVGRRRPGFQSLELLGHDPWKIVVDVTCRGLKRVYITAASGFERFTSQFLVFS